MKRRNWTREQLIVAFNLYCRIEFSKINYRNPAIIKLAEAIDRTPSAVAWKLVNFASLDPSLIKRGIKGASNSGKLDKIVFEEFTSNWEELAFESEMLLKKLFKEKVSVEDEVKFSNGKEDIRKVKARVNQSFFRRTVLSSYNNRCCITGIDIPQLLIASHIVPWSKDSKNRLNPQNGLCLNNLHDKAFDRGFISLDSDLRLILCKSLKDSKEIYIKEYFHNLEGKEINFPKRFIPDERFLIYHRNNIFRNE